MDEDFFDSPAAQESLRALRAETVARLQAQVARRKALADSPRFQDILSYIRDNDAVINSENLAYFPDSAPVSAEEFSDFCEIVFEKTQGHGDKSSPFPTYIHVLDGVEVTLLIGQGSCLIARRVPKTGVSVTAHSAPRPVIG